MTKRITAGIILLFSIFWAPFWLQVFLALVFLFYFKNYYEFVLLFLLSDLLYAVPSDRFWGIRLFSFFLSIVVFAGVALLKTKLSFYTTER